MGPSDYPPPCPEARASSSARAHWRLERRARRLELCARVVEEGREAGSIAPRALAASLARKQREGERRASARAGGARARAGVLEGRARRLELRVRELRGEEGGGHDHAARACCDSRARATRGGSERAAGVRLRRRRARDRRGCRAHPRAHAEREQADAATRPGIEPGRREPPGSGKTTRARDESKRGKQTARAASLS